MAQLTVLNPVAIPQSELRSYPLAPRDGRLQGKRVGLWWNQKRGGDLALKRVEELLRGRCADLEFVWYRDYFPASAEIVARAARECQAVVGSTGD